MKRFLNQFYNRFFLPLLAITTTMCFLLISIYSGWLDHLTEPDGGGAEFVATIFVGITAFFLGLIQLISSNSNFKRELYSDFNRRYDGLNVALNRIHKREPNKIYHKNTKDEKCCCCCCSNKNEERTDRDVVVDYINLCAEEYYWYCKGRIEYKVWMHWLEGMKYHFSNDFIKSVIKEEVSQKDSYYKIYEMPEVRSIISNDK